MPQIKTMKSTGLSWLQVALCAQEGKDTLSLLSLPHKKWRCQLAYKSPWRPSSAHDDEQAEWSIRLTNLGFRIREKTPSHCAHTVMDTVLLKGTLFPQSMWTTQSFWLICVVKAKIKVVTQFSCFSNRHKEWMEAGHCEAIPWTRKPYLSHGQDD